MSMCKDCRFGSFPMTEHRKPRIVTGAVGRCLAEAPRPILPMCIPQPDLNRHGIWEDSQGDCPMFAVKRQP